MINKNLILAITSALLIFAPSARGCVGVWTSSIMSAGCVLIGSFWVLKNLNPSQRKSLRTAIDLPILLFAVLAVLSAIFSVYKLESYRSLIKLVSYIILFYVAANEFDRRMRSAIVMVVIFAGTAFSALGILQYYGFVGHPWWVPGYFLSSTYVNHNHFAGYLELVIPVAMALLFAGDDKHEAVGAHSIAFKAFIISALVIMIPAFVLTQSRGGWISLVIAILVLGLSLWRIGLMKRMVFAIFIIAALIAGVFVYINQGIIYDRLDSATGDVAGDASLDSRMLIWQGAAGMIKARPVYGWGIGTFMYAFNAFRPVGIQEKANTGHNDYIHMAAEMGLLAPLLMLWIFAVVVIKGLNRKDALRIGCAAAVLSLAIHGFIDYNFHIPANMLLFSLWCGLIMRGRNIRENTNNEEDLR